MAVGVRVTLGAGFRLKSPGVMSSWVGVAGARSGFSIPLTRAVSSRPVAVIGDWDGNGTDTIGQVGSDGVWSIRNSNNSGDSNGQFSFGSPGATPIVW